MRYFVLNYLLMILFFTSCLGESDNSNGEIFLPSYKGLYKIENSATKFVNQIVNNETPVSGGDALEYDTETGTYYVATNQGIKKN